MTKKPSNFYQIVLSSGHAQVHSLGLMSVSFGNADLETLLGNDPARWVDNSWMPKAPFAAMLHDLFEMRLGMPTTVRARHIVERLEDIAKAGTPDEVADVATPIIRHLVERCSKFTEKDFEELSALQDLEFLPAVVDGKRDQENLYPPVDVFRAGRAPGFASQVPVIDLTPLRQAGSAVNDVLSLLGVPEEPETGGHRCSPETLHGDGQGAVGFSHTQC